MEVNCKSLGFLLDLLQRMSFTYDLYLKRSFYWFITLPFPSVHGNIVVEASVEVWHHSQPGVHDFVQLPWWPQA